MREQAHGSDAHATRATNHVRRRTVQVPVIRTQHGVIAIMLGVLLPVIIGILGLSLELAQIYNRKAEMQAVADAMALSAAKQLNGTPEGITNAVAAARDVVESGYDWTKLKYGYRRSMVFSESAIKFGRSPNGTTWLAQAAAKAAPGDVAYVQVDTEGLGAYGKVDLLLMPVVSTLRYVEVGHTTVAGRRRLKVTPLAICAMSSNPSEPIQERNNGAGYSELSEYGFRRGVSYNLLKLNPKGQGAVHYLVDPIGLPPKSSQKNFADASVGPYVCTGTVELPGIVGKRIGLQEDFPIGKLVNHLNSRFDASKGDCSTSSAPPDSNIRQFSIATNTWMNKPSKQVAESSTSVNPDRLQTIADLPPPNVQDPTHYGPLWTFARAVPWASYVQERPEPTRGFTPFPAKAETWKGLYSPGPTMNTYPSGTSGLLSPYFTQVTAPTVNPPGIQYRRVLNVPLLECPAAGMPGNVAAIGKFFMTVQADANGIYAEFAGVASREEFAGPVELYK